jgi:signal transduction histidine kinase
MENIVALAQESPAGQMAPVKSQTRLDDNELINILIVDDESRNLTVLETILDDARYRLVRAESADQALLALVVEDFALLILDIRMPGMTGFELARMIKERKKTARVPIIFLTAYYNEDQHILEGYGNGAVDYLHKPVNAAILRSKVAVFAELHVKNRELTAVNRCLLAEVSERRRAEDQLRELNETLEQRVTERTASLQHSEFNYREAKTAAENANKAKDQFLAVLSHELRTPLTPVLTAVQMMQVTGGLRDDDLESLRMIQRNIELEVRLIDDLLDLNRINQGKVKLHMMPVDLNEVLRQVNGICDSDIRSKAIKLNMELKAERHYVRGDAARLQQILWNLLKNAVKFTPVAGVITVRAENPQPDRVRISVCDTGVGIQPENLPLVFNAFEQGEYDREFGGLGLGLAISRHMAELHGGTLTAHSDGRNRGATFTLELGVDAGDDRADARPRAVDRHAPHQRCRILLVEDHADSRFAIGRTFKHWGYDFRIAENVAAALKLADAETFDLVVSDIGLPDGSGLDLMRQLRAKRPVKGIALSGYGMQEDVRRSQDAGFTEHLTKPVSLHQLEAAVQRILDDSPDSSRFP